MDCLFVNQYFRISVRVEMPGIEPGFSAGWRYILHTYPIWYFIIYLESRKKDK